MATPSSQVSVQNAIPQAYLSSDLQQQNEQIKKLFSDVIIILSALAIIGTAITFFIIPISSATLSIIVTSIFVAFAAALILRPPAEDPLDPSHALKAEMRLSESASRSRLDSDTSISSEVEDLEPDEHVQKIQELFDKDPAKLYFFLSNRSYLANVSTKLGASCFSKNMSKALGHAAKLDNFLLGWEGELLSELTKRHIQTGHSAAIHDPHSAKTDEIAQFPKGITNPSGNCFINATLQALFQNSAIGAAVLEQINTIATSDKYMERKALDHKACTVRVEKSSDQAELMARKDAMITDLLKDKKYTEMKALDSYELAEVLKLNLSDDDIRSQLYLTCTLKEAATYSYALLTKWQGGALINDNEAILLRLSLIKLMNRTNSIVLDKTTFIGISTYRARWDLAGIHGDFSIRPQIHEDASLFIRNVLESIDSISRSINSDVITPNIFIKVDRQLKAFKIPEAPADGSAAKPHFDESLAIEGAISKYTQVLSAIHPCYQEEKFKLDSLACFSDYKSGKKESVTYKASENLPNTNVGDTVSELCEYKVTMPEHLVTSLNIFDYINQSGTKHAKTVVEFTDEKDLTIKFPKNDLFDEDITYKLESFVVHFGTTVKGGHYYTLTRKTRADGTSYWMKQNDDEVTPCSSSEALSLLKGQCPFYNVFLLVFNKV